MHVHSSSMLAGEEDSTSSSHYEVHSTTTWWSTLQRSTWWSILQKLTWDPFQYLVKNMEPNQVKNIASFLIQVIETLCSQLPPVASKKVKSFLNSMTFTTCHTNITTLLSSHYETWNPSPLTLLQSNNSTNCKNHKKKCVIEYTYNFMETLYYMFSTSWKRIIGLAPLTVFNNSTLKTTTLEKTATQSQDDTSDRLEEIPTGYAIEYLERESNMPWSVQRQMRRKMYYSVPVNFFYAKVEFQDQAEIESGAISPDSFPPTPIARAYHSHQLNVYTNSVLDGTQEALLCAVQS